MGSVVEDQDWKPLSEKEQSETGFTEYCEFEHACEGWSKKRKFKALRRLVLKKVSKRKARKNSKSQKNENQLLLFDVNELSELEKLVDTTETDEDYVWVYEYMCYVHSDENSAVKTHKFYKKRGTCETWIDEAKNQTALCKIRTKHFKVNDIFFQCSILAYNIIRYMALLSRDKSLFRFEIQTIRTFFIRVAGKLVRSGNQYKLKYTEGLLFERQWDAWCSHAQPPSS